MSELTLQYVPAKKIVINELNPRKNMGDLVGLRQSIVSNGLIQPLTVRQYKGNGKFEIIAGERRFTAINEAIELGELPNDYKIPVIADFTIDDNQAVQMMLIENLMRKDLSDYEQAASFKAYLDKFEDTAAIDDLAMKTGVNIQYIRRRAKVMELPEEVLSLWNAGKLAYGHLEQLLRLNAEDAIACAKSVIDGRWSVSYLKDRIESNKAILGDALFDIKAAGCNKCQFSTKVQKALFGDDFKADKVMCTSPKCFHEKQTAHLMENWKNLPEVKKHKTNGIVIDNNWHATHSMYKATVKACKKCENYVTHIYPEGRIVHDRACKGDDKCFKANYETVKDSTTGEQMTPEQITAEKVEKKDGNCGKDFAEKFYEEKLSIAIISANDGIETARVILMAMVKGNTKAWAAVMKNNGEDIPNWDVSDRFITLIPTMEAPEVHRWTRDIAVATVMSNQFTLQHRRDVAKQFDVLIERDFVMTDDYLKRKTKAQLIELSAKFKIIKSHTTKELEASKKSDIIPKIMEKDLAGIIPDEIIAVAEGKYDRKSYSLEDDDKGEGEE